MNVNVKAFILLAFALLCGCCSERNSAVPMVEDVGFDVATKYRYRLSCAYEGESSKRVGLQSSFLAKCHPRVFSSAGLPVVLRIGYDKMDVSGNWTVFLGMCSIGVIPGLNRYSFSFKCSVELADEADGRASFELVSMSDCASTWLPTAFLFYNGASSVDGRRVFCQNTRLFGEKGPPLRALEYNPLKRMESDPPFRRALAYAIAVKLKELEDSGKVDAMLRKRMEQRPAAPAHNIVQLERDPNGEFSYSFVIEMTQTPSDFKAAARGVLVDFMKSVKEEYLDAFPGADAASLEVVFSSLKRDGLRLSGRATVLTIKPISLAYDANTRRGKLSVKFNAGQAKEARDWIRRNIKALVRDKNIALVTGQLPPEAVYSSLGEKIVGNVMEIEFRTE